MVSARWQTWWQAWVSRSRYFTHGRAKQRPHLGPNDLGETIDHELRRLRRENADLKRDRDALEKSIAVFAKKRK